MSTIADALFRKYVRILREFLVVENYTLYQGRRMLGTLERNRCGLLDGMFLNYTAVIDV